MHFVIHAIDRSDAGSLREHTRPTHLDYLGGFDVVFGGPMLDDDGAMCGSLIVVQAEDRAAAEAHTTHRARVRAPAHHSHSRAASTLSDAVHSSRPVNYYPRDMNSSMT